MAISVYSRGPQHALISGRSGAGAIPLPGVRKGETIAAVMNNGTGANESANFEATISVAGQIQQTSASNLSANEYWAISIA
jgi:hypothetical protein